VAGSYVKTSVVGATHAGNSANNTGGCGGESLPQKPIPGPVSPGPPASMRKALARKTVPSGTGLGLVNKGTSAPGSR
jgi:hypothetical protein